MVSTDSFDDTIFTLMVNSINVSCAAKLVEGKYAIFSRSSSVSEEHNSFPLFAILYKDFILMFFFKIYISKQNNELYLEFKGISQKTASIYVPALYDGIVTISLNNTKNEIYDYLINKYMPYVRQVLQNTSYEFKENKAVTLLNSKWVAPFLDMGKWQFIDKKKIGVRPPAPFSYYEAELRKAKNTIPIIRASEYKIIDFEVYKGFDNDYVYIISKGYIWGVILERYNYFLTYLSKEQKIYKELEVL